MRPRIARIVRDPRHASLVGALAVALALVLAAPSIAVAQEEKAPEVPPPAARSPDAKREGAKAPPAASPDAPDGRAPQRAAEDAITARARERYGFAAWPGREGPSRDGIDLSEIQLPGLPPVSRDLRAAPGGPVATIRFGGSMRALVWVEATPAAAQEALLTWLAGCTLALDRVVAGAGKFAPEGPGDVAYARFDADGAQVAFARGNVATAILGPENVVLALAARIDALALESPELERPAGEGGGKGERVAGRKPTAPRTLRFEEVAPADPVDAARRHEVRLLALAKGDVVRREVTAEGALVTEAEDGTITVRARRAGRVSVTLHALSPRGLRASLCTDVELP